MKCIQFLASSLFVIAAQNKTINRFVYLLFSISTIYLYYKYKIKGIKLTKLGKHLYTDEYVKVSENEYLLTGEPLINDEYTDRDYKKTNNILPHISTEKQSSSK